MCLKKKDAQFLQKTLSPPQQPYECKLTTKTKPSITWTTIQSEDTISTIIITFIINTTSSLTEIQNSVYSTIFTIIHNLITYTNVRTSHLELDKNTFTMDKSPPKCLEMQSNQRTSIWRHVKVKRSKKLQQQSSFKTEATKVNTIMEQLDELDGNGHRMRNNINHFESLYE